MAGIVPHVNVLGLAACEAAFRHGGDWHRELIAYLRGGANEALRVAMVSLVDRKLLKADGTTLKTRGHVTADPVRHPVEKALIEHFKTAPQQKVFLLGHSWGGTGHCPPAGSAGQRPRAVFAAGPSA